MGTKTDVLVLRKGAPALPAEEFYDALLSRLPSYTVRFARTPKQEMELIRDTRVVTGGGLTEELIRRGDSLKYYAHPGIGTDMLPLELLGKQNIAVTNASGLMPHIAEQIMGYLLFFARRLDLGWERSTAGHWCHYQPSTLRGSKIVIVGLGSIGTQLAEQLQGFGVETIGIRYTPEKGGPTDQVVGYDGPEFDEALAAADYVVVCCPLTEQTRGLLGEEELATIPVDATLINVARGKVVDTDALTTTLRRGKLEHAALDVTDPEPLPEDHPLWSLDNVLITPHNAGNAPEFWENLASLVAENLDRIAESKSYTGLRNQVLKPE